MGIISDFDGTLCPTSSIKQNNNNNTSSLIPRNLEEILHKVSATIPICIVTSKDFDFVYPKTKSFAKIISCILGLETFVLNANDKVTFKENIKFQKKITHKKSFKDDIVKENEYWSRFSPIDRDILSDNSKLLEEVVVNLEKRLKKSNIEKKFLKDDYNSLGGITIDWRDEPNWNENTEKYKEIVKEAVFNSSIKTKQKKGTKSLEDKNQLNSPRLFIHEYFTHPFIDVYISTQNKGTAFDFIISDLLGLCNKNAKIIYFGDSENDNPVFRKVDISIGVKSDKRLNPNLDCKYKITYENLPIFLKRLKHDNFIFTESLLNF